MTALSDRLGSEHFIRVRRSALVRLDQIESIRDRGYGYVHVLLRSGPAVRVGRTYLKPLRERMSPKAAGYAARQRPLLTTLRRPGFTGVVQGALHPKETF